MLHAICDFCGKDCARNAILLSLQAFQNFARYHCDNTPYGSVEPIKSFIICSDCRRKHKLPNPFEKYNAITDQNLKYNKTLQDYMEDNNA